MKLSTPDIRAYIQNKIAAHFRNGGVLIELVSGDIERELKIKDCTPQVCGVMQEEMERHLHHVVERPFKWQGTRLCIRYYKDTTAMEADDKHETIVRPPKGVSGNQTRPVGLIKQTATVDPEHIRQTLFDFYNEIIKDPNGRFKSWEHCYNFFKLNRTKTDADTLDRMSLHLAFYLASWGMLRGSAFLLQKDYLVHLPAIRIMIESKYARLWQADGTMVDLIIECGERVSKAYEQQAKCKRPSQTLLTKILLGVFGCVPAYDRYFISGLKKYGLTATYGKRSLFEVFKFYSQNSGAFEDAKQRIKQNGAEYTSMKLADMFFWEEGVKMTNRTHEEALADDEE